ncbi:MAG: hypothetical protein CMP75_04410 [Flavobacteriales bacterium]|nr:hypothetical protein [Flavobacteriales bacterium]|tara:strand:- start:1049 stop:1639 length:591 start_codon:yes stop_codon:yes gene_type:complete
MGKIIFTFLLSISLALAQNPVQTANDYTQAKKNATYKELLYVSVKTQKMYHIINNEVVKKYTISTAKKGTGNRKNSNQTPLGLHSVKEKHGDNTPLNGRMIGRIFYGQIATIYKDSSRSKTDDVTTRIFWLSGEEEGINKGGNVDSYERYIYIHGTSEEGRLGKPASHGCIRMSNKDVLNLYNKVATGIKVLILDK